MAAKHKQGRLTAIKNKTLELLRGCFSQKSTRRIICEHFDWCEKCLFGQAIGNRNRENKKIFEGNKKTNHAQDIL